MPDLGETVITRYGRQNRHSGSNRLAVGTGAYSYSTSTFLYASLPLLFDHFISGIMEDNTDNSAQDAALRQLSSVLQSLESNPDDVTLLKRQITLMQELQMSFEVLDATMRLASLIMLGEGRSYIGDA